MSFDSIIWWVFSPVLHLVFDNKGGAFFLGKLADVLYCLSGIMDDPSMICSFKADPKAQFFVIAEQYLPFVVSAFFWYALFFFIFMYIFCKIFIFIFTSVYLFFKYTSIQKHNSEYVFYYLRLISTTMSDNIFKDMEFFILMVFVYWLVVVLFLWVNGFHMEAHFTNPKDSSFYGLWYKKVDSFVGKSPSEILEMLWANPLLLYTKNWLAFKVTGHCQAKLFFSASASLTDLGFFMVMQPVVLNTIVPLMALCSMLDIYSFVVEGLLLVLYAFDNFGEKKMFHPLWILEYKMALFYWVGLISSYVKFCEWVGSFVLSLTGVSFIMKSLSSLVSSGKDDSNCCKLDKMKKMESKKYDMESLKEDILYLIYSGFEGIVKGKDLMRLALLSNCSKAFSSMGSLVKLFLGTFNLSMGGLVFTSKKVVKLLGEVLKAFKFYLMSLVFFVFITFASSPLFSVYCLTFSLFTFCVCSCDMSSFFLLIPFSLFVLVISFFKFVSEGLNDFDTGMGSYYKGLNLGMFLFLCFDFMLYFIINFCFLYFLLNPNYFTGFGVLSFVLFFIEVVINNAFPVCFLSLMGCHSLCSVYVSKTYKGLSSSNFNSGGHINFNEFSGFVLYNWWCFTFFFLWFIFLGHFLFASYSFCDLIMDYLFIMGVYPPFGMSVPMWVISFSWCGNLSKEFFDKNSHLFDELDSLSKSFWDDMFFYFWVVYFFLPISIF